MTYGMKKRKEIAARMKTTKPFFAEKMSDMGGNRGNKNDPGNAKPVASATEHTPARHQMKVRHGHNFKGNTIKHDLPARKYL